MVTYSIFGVLYIVSKVKVTLSQTRIGSINKIKTVLYILQPSGPGGSHKYLINPAQVLLKKILPIFPLKVAVFWWSKNLFERNKWPAKIILSRTMDKKCQLVYAKTGFND